MTISKVPFTMLKGLSTDTKPTYGQDIGDMFYERDTGALFIFGSGVWNNLTLDADPATLSSKTIPIDDNIIKHSTTNTGGDVLTYSGTRYNRVARGTSGQVLGVNAANDGTAFFSLTSGHIPSTIAYENEANTFTLGQRFNSTMDMQITSTSAPSSGLVRLFAQTITGQTYGSFMYTMESGVLNAVRIA